MGDKNSQKKEVNTQFLARFLDFDNECWTLLRHIQK